MSSPHFPPEEPRPLSVQQQHNMAHDLRLAARFADRYDDPQTADFLSTFADMLEPPILDDDTQQIAPITDDY